MPPLTEKNKADLTRCAEDILLAREAHWPATIADLYDPDAMPEDLKAAHDRNDETLERIYIGRRFRNDTERLEKLFDMYTKMTASIGTTPAKAVRKAKKQMSKAPNYTPGGIRKPSRGSRMSIMVAIPTCLKTMVGQSVAKKSYPLFSLTSWKPMAV